MSVLREEEKRLVIAVDPGFNATKITVNGLLVLDIPKDIVDITGNMHTMIGEKGDEYYVSRYIAGKEYLVGHNARKLMLEKENQTTQDKVYGALNSYKYFETTESDINIMTAIGVALIKYAKWTKNNKIKPTLELDNMEDWEIFLGIALPHQAVDKVRQNLKMRLAKTHEYSVETKDAIYHLKFSIKEDRCVFISQAIVALLGTTSDENGHLIKGSKALDNLPALVIDGGYLTVGIFKFTRVQTVEGAESNTNFAMSNIYERIAEKIKREYGRDNIKSFNIQAILDEGGKIVVMKDKNTEYVDIKKMVKEEEKAVFQEFIAYINDKYDDLIDIKQVLFTGGTGNIYYKYMKEYVKDHKGHLVDHILLTNYEFYGKEIDPVYAICLGLYKTMRNLIEKMDKKNKVN